MSAASQVERAVLVSCTALLGFMASCRPSVNIACVDNQRLYVSNVAAGVMSVTAPGVTLVM